MCAEITIAAYQMLVLKLTNVVIKLHSKICIKSSAAIFNYMKFTDLHFCGKMHLNSQKSHKYHMRRRRLQSIVFRNKKKYLCMRRPKKLSNKKRVQP